MAEPKQGTKVRPTWDSLQRKLDRRQRWSWTEASIWTDGMLVALENGVKGGKWQRIRWPNAFFAKRGLFTMETTRVFEVACRSRSG